MFTLLDSRVPSLRAGHANLLRVVPISTDDPEGNPLEVDHVIIATINMFIIILIISITIVVIIIIMIILGGVFLVRMVCPARCSEGRKPLIAGCLSLQRLRLDVPVTRLYLYCLCIFQSLTDDPRRESKSVGEPYLYVSTNFGRHPANVI